MHFRNVPSTAPMKDVCKHRAAYQKLQFLLGNCHLGYKHSSYKSNPINRCEAISTPHKRVPQISNVNSIRPAQRQKSIHNSSMIDVGGKAKQIGKLKSMFCNVVTIALQVNSTAIDIVDARS